MLRKTFYIFIFSLVTLIFSTCNDPVFYTVSQSISPIPPLISGTPTNFVEWNNAMYVASGRNIWEYKNDTNLNKWIWTRYGQDKRIRRIAATSSSLYAVCDDLSVKSFNSPTTSSTVIFNAKLIFAANNILYYETYDGQNNGSIYSYNGTASTPITYGGETLKANLRGVASNYLVTNNKGVFSVSGTTATLIPGSDDKRFTGIIQLNNTVVVAMTRDGNLYKIESNNVSQVASLGRLSPTTGALALWTKGTDNLLLAGRQEYLGTSTTSGYTYGYMELELDASKNIVAGANFREPGTGSPTTTDNNERFRSSIGAKAVNHIFQAGDNDNTLFASTQLNGVWSLKDRGDGNGISWNAEN